MSGTGRDSLMSGKRAPSVAPRPFPAINRRHSDRLRRMGYGPSRFARPVKPCFQRGPLLIGGEDRGWAAHSWHFWPGGDCPDQGYPETSGDPNATGCRRVATPVALTRRRAPAGCCRFIANGSCRRSHTRSRPQPTARATAVRLFGGSHIRQPASPAHKSLPLRR
jgi:hypothetical protein